MCLRPFRRRFFLREAGGGAPAIALAAAAAAVAKAAGAGDKGDGDGGDKGKDKEEEASPAEEEEEDDEEEDEEDFPTYMMPLRVVRRRTFAIPISSVVARARKSNVKGRLSSQFPCVVCSDKRDCQIKRGWA